MDAQSVQSQIALRARKLGVLIRDARVAHRKTVNECAKAIGVSPSLFRAFEDGRKAPSLPVLEALSYYLDLTIQHFWSAEVLSDDAPRTEPLDLAALASVRHRLIGALFRQKRLASSVSVKTVSVETGIPQGRIKAYELGERPMPLPELEVCLDVIGTSIDHFFDQNGPIGLWMMQQLAIQDFMKLPPDLQNFVRKPGNRPYIELAQNLSNLSAEKLRSVAEVLLDITL